MSKRTAKFVSTIFAALLAGAHLTTGSDNAARAADTCLPGPKGVPSQGGHWYYRVDRATQRHCWYIGDEKQKLARAAPSADPVAPRQAAATPPSIADARAELPLPQRLPERTSVAAGQPATTDSAGIQNNQRGNAENANPQLSIVASRWTGQPDATDISEPTANPRANVSSNSKTPTPAAIPLAAADASSSKQAGSIQMVLLVIVGALSLAGLMGSAIFRFGNPRWTGRRQIRDRRAIWDSVDTAGSSSYPGLDSPVRSVDKPGDRRTADDPDRRIADMLAQLSRGATA